MKALHAVVSPQPSERTLPSVLRELGLRELSMSAWLKAPKAESATELRDGMLRRLGGAAAERSYRRYLDSRSCSQR